MPNMVKRPKQLKRHTDGVWHRLIDLTNDIDATIKKIDRLPATKIPTDRFEANVTRIACMSGSPWQFIRDYMVAGHLFGEATRRATNGREWRYGELTPGQLRLAIREYNRLHRALTPRKRRNVEKGLAIANAKEAFNRLLSSSGERRQFGVEAIMASIIVSSWTAFEVLAEDLWVSSVNARPRLGMIVLDAELKDSDAPKEVERKQGVIFELPVWTMLDPKFKIQKRMGDLLRNYNRSWVTRDGPTKTYRKTFPDLKGQVTAIFGDKKLRWAESTRNAIVHNSGHADKQFLAGTQDHPVFKTVQDKTAIPINGEIAHELCMGAIGGAVSLLDFVNSWLKNNPT
jgi:hypothetical protein